MNELYLNRSEVRIALIKRDDADGLKAIDALNIHSADDLRACAPSAGSPASALTELDFPVGARFSFKDDPGEHDPCYVVMPGGAALAVNHHARPGVDIARAKFIVSACNAAFTAEKDEDETYEIGKRDGYSDAVQQIDVLTGGDGEYRYCTDGDPDRHTPDPATMIQRIVDRFSELQAPQSAASTVEPAAASREQIAKVFSMIWHGDLGEWQGFLSKADDFLAYPWPATPPASAPDQGGVREALNAALTEMEHVHSLVSAPHAARYRLYNAIIAARAALTVSQEVSNHVAGVGNMVAGRPSQEAGAGDAHCAIVPTEITDEMRYATWKAQALHVGATELEAIQMANRRMTPEQRRMDQAAYAAMLAVAPASARNERGVEAS